MGWLRLDGEEKNLYRDLLYDGMEQYGTDAEVFIVVGSERDLQQNVRYIYDVENPIEISILFDEEPKPKLRKYGWLMDGLDVEQSLIYIVPKVDGNPLNITKGALVRVKAIGEGSVVKTYFIGEVHGSELSGVYYECSATPYRQSIFIDINEGEVVDSYKPGGSLFVKNEYKEEV